jgi:restriction endonuclease S subunit
MTSTTQLERKIEKAREQLYRLETQLLRIQRQAPARRGTQEQKLNRLEAQFKKKYPNVKVDRELLSLVGTLPRIPRSVEKQIIRDAVAERHG